MLATLPGFVSVHPWEGTAVFRAAIAPTATTETATAMNASCAVVNDPMRAWVLISDIATAHRRTAERITRKRNEYRRKVVRGSMVAVECTPETGYARLSAPPCRMRRVFPPSTSGRSRSSITIERARSSSRP